jgi:hypothetical protein
MSIDNDNFLFLWGNQSTMTKTNLQFNNGNFGHKMGFLKAFIPFMPAAVMRSVPSLIKWKFFNYF